MDAFSTCTVCLLLLNSGLLISAVQRMLSHAHPAYSLLSPVSEPVNDAGTLRIGRWLSRFARYRWFAVLNGLRLITGLLLPVFVFFDLYVYVPAFILLVCQRMYKEGLDRVSAGSGADRFPIVLLFALTIGCFDRSFTSGSQLSLVFIALLASIAYISSAICKMNRRWLSGKMLQEITSFEVFGNKAAHRFFSARPIFAVAGTAVVILTELAMGCAAFLPPGICLYVLFAGVLFHLSIAIVMRISLFAPVFVSTYPAILFVSMHHHLLWVR